MVPRYGIRSIRVLFSLQLGVGLVLLMLAMIFSNKTGVQSAMLGSLVYIIPNALCATKMFQYQGARSAKKIVNSFYKAEALKFALSIVLFAAVFVFFKINPLIFFGAYISMQMVIWFAPLIFN